MEKPFKLLYRFRVWLVFVALSATALRLSSKAASPALFVRDWLQSIAGKLHISKSLPTENSLVIENARLKENLIACQAFLDLSKPRALSYTLAPQHRCVPAVVVGHFSSGFQTYITLNRGKKNGVTPGMGVVNEEGVVGRVRAVSDHFCTVTSLLHTAMYVSSLVHGSHSMGTVHWSGDNTQCVDMLYVPRHLSVHAGDLIVTSGYNATFPADIPIGHVQQATLRRGAPFYDIRIRLAADFSALHHVYVIQNCLANEQISLEKDTQELHT